MISLCIRAQREAWITAKYVKRAFVCQLPEMRNQSENRINSWSVRKKPRRIPGRGMSKSNSKDESSYSDSEGVASGLMEGNEETVFEHF